MCNECNCSLRRLTIRYWYSAKAGYFSQHYATTDKYCSDDQQPLAIYEYVFTTETCFSYSLCQFQFKDKSYRIPKKK